MFRTIIFSLGILFLFSSCQEIKEFRGEWRGGIKQTRLVRKGLDVCSVLVLDIRDVSSSTLDASIRFERNPDMPSCSADIPDEDPVVISLPSENADIEEIHEYLNDALSGMSFEGDPLFTHLAWVTIDARTIGVVISFLRGPKINVRIVSPGLYGVFRLEKSN
ncbi:MAG: hypothetical protein JXR95_07470 [Deltaproteobacteria bacterium]|nr:hypothetical protein [Deltaproteobacteria bacterium]